MKLSRIIATGAAFALVGTLGLVGATSASADDLYVTAPLPAETGPYSAGWFAGDVAAGGSATSGLSGITLVGPYQILNGTTSAAGLVAMAASASLNTVSGDAYFQIPLWGNGAGAGTHYTTLVPTVSGNTGLHSTAADAWRTTYPIYDADNTTVLYAAGSLHTLQEFETALAQTNYKVLAFGAFVDPGTTAVISSITWEDNTHWFLPRPTATVSPSSISVTDSATAGKGVTGTFTGFVPGESVEVYYGTDSSGDLIDDTLVADNNGSVTYTYVAPKSMTVGDYRLGVYAPTSGANVSAAFSVVADTLAATGVEATPFIFTGGILLLLGAGLVVSMTTMRRRAAAQR